jgi:drug/metabolite transporter (DMT)-like permease
MGYLHSSVLNGVLLISLQSPLSIILSHFFLREKIRINQALGIGVILIGFIAYNTNFFADRLHLSLTDGYFILAAVAFAVSNLIYKKKLSHISHELALITRNLIGGLAIFLGITLFSLESNVRVSFDTQSLIGIGLIVLVPILLAQSLWYTSLEKIKSTEAAFFDTLYPLFAALIAYVSRGESITLPQLEGTMVILAGVLLSQIHWHWHPSAWREIRLQQFKQQ